MPTFRFGMLMLLLLTAGLLGNLLFLPALLAGPIWRWIARLRCRWPGWCTWKDDTRRERAPAPEARSQARCRCSTHGSATSGHYQPDSSSFGRYLELRIPAV